MSGLIWACRMVDLAGLFWSNPEQGGLPISELHEVIDVGLGAVC